MAASAPDAPAAPVKSSARPPPASTIELLRRAEDLAGTTLGELAAELGWPVPESSLRGKGWAGQLLEAALGASAGSKPLPDFEALGVELKTIPLRDDGRPRESTFVCNAELLSDDLQSFANSRVWHKLSRVLWVPTLGGKGAPPGSRTIAMPTLWEPTEAEREALRADWEELMELITLGSVEHVSAEHGDCLQLRPKGANRDARTHAIDASGRRVKVLPLGFYLRAGFTGGVLAGRYARLSRDGDSL